MQWGEYFSRSVFERMGRPLRHGRRDTVRSLPLGAMSNGTPKVLNSLRGDDLITVTRRQQVFGGAVLNILVNVVVLNLFVEFVDEVVIDSFWISVLTAVLLTAMIGLLSRFEHRIHHFFFERHSWKVAGVIVIWLVLFGGKFVMLEVVDIVFGDHVYLGHLLEVILIVVAMMVAAQIMQAIYDRLGAPAARADDSPVS